MSLPLETAAEKNRIGPVMRNQSAGAHPNESGAAAIGNNRFSGGLAGNP